MKKFLQIYSTGFTFTWFVYIVTKVLPLTDGMTGQVRTVMQVNTIWFGTLTILFLPVLLFFLLLLKELSIPTHLKK